MLQDKESNTYDKQLVALGRVLQTLREEENSDVLMEMVIAYLQAEFDYDLIWIGLYDRVEHRLFGKGGVAPGGEVALLKQRIALSPGDILEQVVIQQRPVAVPDLREEMRVGEWRKVAKKLDIQGTVIFPIRYRDRCYGVVLMGSLAWGVSPKSDEKARLSMVLGELAAALYKIEVEWLRQQVKHPDQPLLALLSTLRSLTGLGPRLEAVIEETHRFIQPVRTSIYWYERERRYFWRRLGNRQRNTGFGEVHQPASGITVQEVSGFYQALAADQLVAIGEAHSSLKADTTSRLMQQIKARSLLAAPIIFQDELLGFLAVEGTEPRIWAEEEKNFLRGAAQLVSLTAPMDEMETTIEQIRMDQELMAEIARSIYDEDDWKTTLKQTADQLCKRLRAERFLVLFYDKDQDVFEISYQNHPSNRRPLLTPLDRLGTADMALLQHSTTAISIENLDGELKLLAWRDRLLELGMRSVILCNTSVEHVVEGVVLIGHEAPRSWSHAERELVRVVSQQIGFILHQWQLQRQTDLQQQINQALQWGLQAMQQNLELEGLQQSALQQLTEILQVPLVVLVHWLPGHTTARIVSSPPPNERFAVNEGMTISMHTDSLIQRALEREGVVQLAITDVPGSSRQWLYGSGIGKLVFMKLQTLGQHEPTGVVIAVDEGKRYWSERHLNALMLLVNQLAWARRNVALLDQFMTHQLDLERLNWYKLRRLEESHRAIAAGLKRLDELDKPKEPLFATRQQQISRSLKDAIVPLAQVVAEEPWKIRAYSSTISLITLLKRSLERVDHLFKERQIWSQVHDETNLTISGDILKIELVLYELLLIASQRSAVSSRIDLWCRQIDNRWLELLITDTGQVEPRLFTELELGRSDWLAPSLLNHPPGLHLQICQSLMKQLGGEFTFYKLEDGRNTSRLVLPLAPNPTLHAASSQKR